MASDRWQLFVTYLKSYYKTENDTVLKNVLKDLFGSEIILKEIIMRAFKDEKRKESACC